MEGYFFFIIKQNIIASGVILLVILISRLRKGKYSAGWKYFMWLAVSLFLLLPVDISGHGPLQLEITDPNAGASAASDASDQADVEVQPAGASERAGVGVRSADTSDQADREVQPTGASERAGVGVQGAGTSAQADIKVLPADMLHAENQISQTGVGAANSDADRTDEPGSLQEEISAAAIHIPLPNDWISWYGLLQLMSRCWLAGVCFLAVLRLMHYCFSMRRLLRWSTPVDEQEICRIYREVCIRKHIKNPPGLMQAGDLSSPVLAGLFQPTLYLTEEDYEKEELRLIFAHELSHCKRRDLWYKLLLQTVMTLYWFNPFLLLMQKEAERDLENLCDASVIEHCSRDECTRYHYLLLKTAAWQNQVPYLAASLNDSTLVFKDRIHYMQNVRKRKEAVIPAMVLTVGMLVLYGAVGCQVQAGTSDAMAGAGKREGADRMPGTGLDAAGYEGSLGTGQGAAGSESQPGTGQGAMGSESQPGTGQGAAGGESQPGTGQGAAGSESQPGMGQGAAGGESQPGTDQGAAGSESQSGTGQGAAGKEIQLLSGQTPDGNQIRPSADQVSASGSDQSAAGTVMTNGTDAENVGLTLTDEQITLYGLDGTGALYIRKATNGSWYDGDGRQYSSDGTDRWICQNNSSEWSASEPDTAYIQSNALDQKEIVDEEGYNQMTIYQFAENGEWYNVAGGLFVSDGNGHWTGQDGSIWQAE